MYGIKRPLFFFPLRNYYLTDFPVLVVELLAANYKEDSPIVQITKDREKSNGFA